MQRQHGCGGRDARPAITGDLVCLEHFGRHPSAGRQRDADGAWDVACDWIEAQRFAAVAVLRPRVDEDEARVAEPLEDLVGRDDVVASAPAA